MASAKTKAIAAAVTTAFLPFFIIQLLLLLGTAASVVVRAENEVPSGGLLLHMVVLTQSAVVPSFEVHRANQLRALLQQQNVHFDELESLAVTLLHEFAGDFNGDDKSANGIGDGEALLQGHWAIWPVLKRFNARMRTARWTLFCSPHTRLPNVQALIQHLIGRNDSTEEKFIGKAFMDEDPTIIHHYHSGFINDDDGPQNDDGKQQQKRFKYPDLFSTGFVLSRPILLRLIAHLEGMEGGNEGNKTKRRLGPNFSIDASFEFAQLLFETTGALLEEDDRLWCSPANISSENVSPEDDCLIQFEAPKMASECARENNASMEGGQQEREEVFYAVKTHTANHGSRVPIIQRTWAKHALGRIGFFSDSGDSQIPTIDLGVPNTERGHCGKTFAILRHFLEAISSANNKGNANENQRPFPHQWLMLADDDTLLSVPRLERFLTCFSADQPLIVGQRYGYGFSTDGISGYDYPTGGAGIAFTRSAVEMITKNCVCPSMDAPDDMIIGLCARRLGIPVLHSPLFHQARPVDYPMEQIQQLWAGQHISFHKFEEIDPLAVYRQLLQESDHPPESAEENDDTTEVKKHEEF